MRLALSFSREFMALSFWATFCLKPHLLGSCCPVAPSEEAHPTLEQWIGFEPVCLETPRTPKHNYFADEVARSVTTQGM
ncbi:hypothetical protein E2C01_019545 [Portunus trituberculatus]|uniref:Secreted protein n=1 Tax=Portunus trituberculatus TaxID=210409 RepID=A0A5B7DZM9_PORTR|nr:hypothetical protein [Portunus trituberculatus]